MGRSNGFESAMGGTQLAVAVLAGLYVGHRVDARWNLGPWGLLVGGAVGLVIGMYSFLKPFFRDR
jgi:F0F1-type ATP synthase assembly protein I